MQRLIRKSGETPWPKLFQNLRVTRENELLQEGEYRRDAIHAFIGHTSETFDANYKHLNDDDFIPKSQRQKVHSPRNDGQEAKNGGVLSRKQKKTSETATNVDDSEVEISSEAPPTGLPRHGNRGRFFERRRKHH